MKHANKSLTGKIDPETFNIIGDILNELGYFGEALKNYEKSLTLN